MHPFICSREPVRAVHARRALPIRWMPDGKTPSRCSRARSPATRWAPQHLPRGSTHPGVDYFPFDPTNWPGYVEHCHILDHEDNEFMRPMLISK